MPARAPRILCVDDHDDTCFMLQTLFGRAGREVTAAASVAAALDVARREDFDLFILDVTFPDGSGIELCKRLRELRPGVPVIFYSGRASADDRRAALEACAEAYVAKPAIDQLLAEVERLLAASAEQRSGAN